MTEKPRTRYTRPLRPGDIKECAGPCHRATRPACVAAAEAPNTVGRASADKCQKCWDDEKGNFRNRADGVKPTRSSPESRPGNAEETARQVDAYTAARRRRLAAVSPTLVSNGRVRRALPYAQLRSRA